MRLRILVRRGVTWSDGRPFSAEDVAFTINAVRDGGAGVDASAYVAPLVEEVVATSAGEVQIRFKIPAARFMFDVFIYAFDRGWPILPKHIFDGQDLASFGNFDPARGLPVTTGPWQVVDASPERIVLDRRDSWWAVDQGLSNALPEVERIVYLPWSSEDEIAAQVNGNEIDSSDGLRPQTIATILGQNPRVTTFTGSRAPFGSVGRGPISLFVNCARDSFADPMVRWAFSAFIDRQQLIGDSLDGAGTISALPMPPFTGLMMYIDGVAELLRQYPTTEFDPEKGAALLMDAGWVKEDGNWAKDGQALTVPIIASEAMAGIGQAVADQLTAQGIEASFSVAPDLLARLESGDYDAAIFGHEGSYSGDPYYTAALYQTRSEVVPGGRPVNVSRWPNAAYDALVEEMALTSIDHEPQADPEKLLDLWQQAMAIWLPELPAIHLLESYDRTPMNQTYWTGWPSTGDPFSNGVFKDRSFQLVLNRLSSVQ
jgi:peptide/nickel transport system substrate-binding protein